MALPALSQLHPRTLASMATASSSPSKYRPPMRFAVLGAGFAGLSVAWHLLKQSSKDARIRVDIFDEVGLGGGASGVAGGLLHPYSPKGKLLWKGSECWKECLELLSAAEKAIEADSNGHVPCSSDERIAWKRGIIRPAINEKNVEILKQNAQSCLESCRLELLDGVAAQRMIPNLHVPYDLAVHMPLAMNIHPKRYLQALFLACQSIVNKGSEHIYEEREVNLFKESIKSLRQLSGEYDAVIICLGAKVDMLPELSGKLPIRMCRGVVAQLQLSADSKEKYRNDSPSILSDAWLAFQGPETVFMGSTWEWKSRNYATSVSEKEASRAMEELLPKATNVYPAIKDWAFVTAKAGLRAMPPLTVNGSLPLLGCLNDIIGDSSYTMFWMVGGLGSRGLLYHGLAGKLIAQAVLCCNKDIIPPEFSLWKMFLRKA